MQKLSIITKNMILISSHLFVCFLFFFIPYPSYGTDTLYANQSLSGDQTLISKGENFVLGFFKPSDSSNYYIGIWYKKISSNPPTTVWVANRETPVSDRFKSELRIVDGNLLLLNEFNIQIWSTNIISTNSNSAVVVIRGDGNLVLRDGSNSVEAVWQSFDHPTDTWLPGSKLKYDNRRNTKQVITSWRISEDPAVGFFSLEIDPNESQYVLKWNKSVQYWTSGSWDGRTFSLIPEVTLNYIYNFSYFSNENESYFTYTLYNPSIISRFTLDISGQIQQTTWLESEKQWNIFWARPITQCQVYASCGSFGTCTESGLPFCNCLTGFQPRSVSDWSLSDFSGGWVRKTKLDCTVKEYDPGFLTSYVPVKYLSSFLENGTSSSDESACRSSCLDDCSCDAYSFGFETCLLWNNETLTNISLVLVSEDANSGTISPVNIKVSLCDLPSHTAKINTKVLISGIVAGFFSLVFLCSIGIIFYKRRGKCYSLTHLFQHR